ncbi:MAG TPA: gamma-glutamyltransferase [Candidatus Binataceae bacterium]|nr:gamma-glutamyltransferase [Candidatus Binataceae bacterium]
MNALCPRRKFLEIAGVAAALCAALLLNLALPAETALAVAAGGAQGRRVMVVSESSYATHAGLEILKHGGNAVDAACAAELAAGVTNPGATGLGGGGFMLIYLAKPHAFYALDFRETAPLKAAPEMYMRNGKADEDLARTGALAVAVPGEIAGISTALKRFGTIKFQKAAGEAESLAIHGFVASPHLAVEIADNAKALERDPELREVFLTAAGTPRKSGEQIAEHNLGAALKSLGDHPEAIFYHGRIAGQIAALMQAKGGIIGKEDLAGYRPIWRDPLQREYHGYEVHAMPPPSSGGVLLEMLGILSPGKLAGLGVNSPPYLARLIEVMREGFIERNRYGDPAFVNVPIEEMLSDRHIAELRDRALHRKALPPTSNAHDHGTSNLIVADADGNVVALTATINTAFGAKIAVPGSGIILNDEMDDFSVAPGVPNAYQLQGAAANEIRPGKRPLSSMTPIIVTKDGRPVMSTGGSGGPTILTGVLQVTLDILDFHLGPEEAVGLPRIHEQAAPATVMAEKSMPSATIGELRQMGYELKTVPALGAIGAIMLEPGNLRGAFDPRKGGAAQGY